MKPYRIADARRAKGLSQQQLAERIGTTQQQLARYESGQRDPKTGVILKISAALGISVSWLLGADEDNRNTASAPKNMSTHRASSLKLAREMSGMTQLAASEQSGIPVGTLRRWEQGVNEPNIDSILLLADTYKVSTDILLGHTSHANAMSDKECELLDAWNSLSDQGRKTVVAVIDSFNDSRSK